MAGAPPLKSITTLILCPFYSLPTFEDYKITTTKVMFPCFWTKIYNLCLKIAINPLIAGRLPCGLKLHNSPSMSARAFSQNQTIATPCLLPPSIYLQWIFLQRLQNNKPTPMFLSSLSKHTASFSKSKWTFVWLAGCPVPSNLQNNFLCLRLLS